MKNTARAFKPGRRTAAVLAPATGLALGGLWQGLMRVRVGILPLPVLCAVLGVTAGFVRLNAVPSDILANIAVLSAGGFLCAEAGKRVPVLRDLGLAAILATFLPSFLVYAKLLPASLVRSITSFSDSSNFLYLFICAVIVGSILGMDRRTLVSGFAKIFVPMVVGSLAAAAVGCAVGASLGLGFKHTLFKIVAPIMAGGVGEGAIPLSIGYAHLSGQPQGDLFAEVLPPVMLGSLTAIVMAGGLNLLGKRRPELSGDGRLQVGEHDPLLEEASVRRSPIDPAVIGGALVMMVTLYLLGELSQTLWNWPAPVVMLFLAVLVKLGRLATPDLEQGAHGVYRFFSICVTYPLLFSLGVSKTPWEKLMAAFTLPTVATIVSTVATLVAVGFMAARFLNMHPIEVAIVTATRAGQGGTGDVAILTAANRMNLMPFAQIATRIGGALTVTAALVAFAKFGG